MICIGLTGGIGSGKSFIAEIFIRLGVPIYNADTLARHISNNNPDVKSNIVSLLGQNAYKKGLLNRQYVGGMVFDNPDLLENLNKIIHPAVEVDFLKWCSNNKEHHYLIKEAAILFETGSYRKLDSTILVVAPEDIRIKRVQKRDNLDANSIKKRIDKQWNDQEKEKLADYIINNDGKTLLLPQIIQIHKRVTNNE